MRKLILIQYLTVSWLLSLAQGDQSKPLPPTFDFLTLNPCNGVPSLSWTPPAFNPLYPDPTGFIIYTPMEGGGWLPIDTVESNVYTYTDFDNTGSNALIRYTLASKGTTEPSQLTSPHGSIYLTARYDSCGNKLDLQWNHYIGWGNRIEEYVVFKGETPNWQSLEPIDTIPGNQNIAYVLDVEPDNFFYLFIKARNRDSDLVSLSNLTGISTKVARKPNVMLIDSIIAKDLHTEIRFRIDKNTEYRNFSLVRWENKDSISSIFTARTLYTFNDPNTRSFSDTTDSWTARSKPFYFKINGYDGCNRLNVVSNLPNSITVRAVTRGLKNTITWDTLNSKDGNTIRYRLYRVTYGDVQQPTEVIFNSTDELTFVDNLSSLEGQGLTTKVCYYVEANELVENRPITTSISRMVCTEIIPDVVMPNAIDPLSNYSSGGYYPRNIFAPTITFKASYRLTIYNRWGGIVFNGVNEGWDGRLANGDSAKEGAYVYRLEVFSETKKTITKTGTLTVIYGPMQ
jgi:hypothetical protein